jgi:predicted nucleotidyltransferase
MASNLDLLATVARQIRPLLDEVVFVGGAIAELYRKVPVLPAARVTTDTDAICHAMSYTEYSRLGARLQELGFSQSLAAADPPYRWRSAAGVLDLMPMDEQVLGFTNRWYAYGLAHPDRVQLAVDLEISILSPPAFLATKLAAFADRGSADPHRSHDLEDIVALVAGRPGLVDEVTAAPFELRGWIGEQVAAFLRRAEASELIDACLPILEARRLRRLVEERLGTLAGQ